MVPVFRNNVVDLQDSGTEMKYSHITTIALLFLVDIGVGRKVHRTWREQSLCFFEGRPSWYAMALPFRLWKFKYIVSIIYNNIKERELHGPKTLSNDSPQKNIYIVRLFTTT